jgi:[pyruvate, water dikinase]-phosphate phosphotransferase / [pyruvate, water dikinase] kinase
MSEEKKNTIPPIYVVSGSRGLAGNHMVQSLLIQYPDNKIPVVIHPGINSEEQINKVVIKAQADNALITHTMVDPILRRLLNQMCDEMKVKKIDFMGELADYLDQQLDVEPLQHPGLYRKANQEYFERIEAIEFTLSHDDGMGAEKLYGAEIVLTGVSRVGKTPLSVYLAMFGWKVANVPIVSGIKPPKELFEVDPNRVFGLHISLPQLISHRRKRMESWASHKSEIYIDEEAVKGELREAMFIFNRGGFTVMNVTNKPIESSANDILNILSERFPYRGKRFAAPH